MLKGILFVIAIIVTFDIGKTLIDQYRAEQVEENSQEVLQQVQQDAVSESASLQEPAQKSGDEYESDEIKQLLDLSLPEGVTDDEEGGDKQGNDKSSSAEQGNMFDKSKGDSQKSMSIKTRPILEFQTEEMKPDVSGLKLDLKKEL